jgi:hypothetical protein
MTGLLLWSFSDIRGDSDDGGDSDDDNDVDGPVQLSRQPGRMLAQLMP